MRIAFGDFCDWDFHAQSVESQPMGGSQSAACYVALALARQGHEVFLLSGTQSPGRYGGVTCLSWAQTSAAILRGLKLDAFVCLLGGPAKVIRDFLGPGPRLILWTQHRMDQPGVQSLAEPVERDLWDAFAFASEWQRGEFLTRFGILPERTHVLRNAVAPGFLDLFPAGQPILPQKAIPPVLAYTSTPFRGLHLLIDAFPLIRAQVPSVRLRVYSSMRVYQTSAMADEKDYGLLYQRCRQTPGIEYVGSLPQPQLAQEMRGVSVLAYPNTFPETFCIAALEAMASGCRIVTSDLGALPETTAGFARLISVQQDAPSYVRDFAAQTVAVLQELQRGDAAAEETLRRQVDYIRENTTYDLRAREWGEWLGAICGKAASS